jgi:hydrogenase-1 operon protein HyaF
MSALDEIRVSVETDTGNLGPIMHEIKHALGELLSSGKTRMIDLRSMPFAPGEEKRLEGLLGQGEVKVSIDALGPSEIIETRFAGVWLSTHRNSENEIIGRYIEITHAPDILLSQHADMQRGLDALQNALQGGAGSGPAS